MTDAQDLGFSEFVAKLISETFTAVVDATIEQERRYGELAGAASLSLEEFASAYVTDEEIDAALRELFPPSAKRSSRLETPPSSSAEEGQPYFGGSRSRPENPPLLAVLGLQVTEDEVAEGTISLALSMRVRAAVAQRVSRDEWQLARAVVSRGVPRVMVDSGHIMAKQTYQVVDTPPPPPPATEEETPPPFSFIRPTLALDRLARPTIRPDLLIRITSPRATDPTSQGNIYGEVQVTFKTVP